MRAFSDTSLLEKRAAQMRQSAMDCARLQLFEPSPRFAPCTVESPALSIVDEPPSSGRRSRRDRSGDARAPPRLRECAPARAREVFKRNDRALLQWPQLGSSE